MPIEAIKKKVGIAAAELIHNRMLVGLGTGTTAFYFIEHLIERCKNGLQIKAVASSEKSRRQAHAGGIPLIEPDKVTTLDITVDGADEIDPEKRMIKGGGGALVREKIVANMSRELVVIVDESKVVPKLGKVKLPVEIVPFAHTATEYKLEQLGYSGNWRYKPDGALYMTDNHNYLFDIHFAQPRSHPEKDHETLIHVPGVVDTGFFFNLAGRVIIGFFDGQIVTRT